MPKVRPRHMSPDITTTTKGPARFCSLDFGERNGYLKGITPIDTQQKNMERLTFSCSRGSS